MSERTFHERPVTIRGHKYIKLKSGRMLTFWETHTAFERARTDLGRALSRAFKLADTEFERKEVERLIEGLEDYLVAVRKHMADLKEQQATQERIAQLRQTTGRTAQEAAAFRAKADELERSLA